MRRVLAIALLAAVVLSTAGAGPAAARSHPAGAPDGPVRDLGDGAADLRQQAQPTPDRDGRTTFRVRLRASGDARWRVVTRYRLDGANETRAFRRYGRSFEAGNATPPAGAALFERLAAASGEVAGREMAIRNVSRTAAVEGDTGRLVLAFTWTNFLGSAGSEGLLVLRDALLLPGGDTWLSTLEPDQRLVIRSPPGYTVNFTSTRLVLQDRSIIIDGPRSFPADAPLTIRYQPTGPDGGPDRPERRLPWNLLAGGALALLIVAAAALRRRGRPGEGAPDEPPADPPSPPDTGTVPEPDADEPDDGADLSLLSDEERVERLLERNDGRMRQAAIVEETGWSDAKVSQLLSTMAEEGRVEKLRLGRENLISLPDAEEE